MATTKKVQYTNKAGKSFAVETTNKAEKGITGYYDGNKKYKQSPVESAKAAPEYYDTTYTNKMGKTYDVKTTQKPVVSNTATGSTTGVVDAGASQQDATTQGQTALDPNNYDYNKYYYSEQEGKFYDKTKGGKEVDIYGNLPAQGAMTDKERIKAQADAPYGDLEKTGADLFGEDNPYKDKGSFEKAILEKFKTESKEDQQYLTEQQQRQRELDLAQLKDAERSGKASAAGAEAALAQGREGIQSIDRPAVISEYKQTIQRDMDQATKRFDMAEASRRRALVELERAKENGERDLVDMWQQSLQRAEMEIEQSRTAMMDAQARNVSLALGINADQRAAQQQSIANFNAFSGLVEQGVSLTPDNILGFSKSLNIPFEDAYSYYQGMQSIRDDKTLSIEQKQIETQGLQQDFQDRMTGYQTKEAQKLRDYTRLVQSGQYTPAEAGAMLGIPTNENPEYVIDMRIKNAEAKIKEIEASGEPVYGSVDYWAREKLKVEVQGERAALNELYGIPNDINGSAVKIGMNSELGNLPPENAKTTNAFGSGIITGYGSDAWSEGLDYYLDGGMGATVVAPVSGEVIQVDTGHKKGEKKSFGNRVKIRMDNGEEIWVSHLQGTNVNVGQIIQAGTVIGTQGNTGSTYGPTGVHLDVTIKKPDGSYYSAKEVQAFLQSAEKLNKKMASGGESGFAPAEIGQFNALIGTKDLAKLTPAQKQSFNEFQAKKVDPSTPLGNLIDLTVGAKPITDSAEKELSKYSLTSDLLGDLSTSIEKSDTDDLNPLIGALRSANPYDVTAQDINQQLQRIVPGLARGVFGEVGVLTDNDIALYRSTLPNMKQTKDVQKLALDMTKRALQRGVERKLRSLASTYDISGYKFMVDDLLGDEGNAADEIDFDSIWESAKLAPSRKDVSIWDNL